MLIMTPVIRLILLFNVLLKKHIITKVCTCLCVSATLVQHVGSYFPDQWLNLCPLQWDHSGLTTGLPGKSLPKYFDNNFTFQAHHLSLGRASWILTNVTTSPITTMWLSFHIRCTKMSHFTSNLRVVRQFSSVQSLGRVQLFATPWIAARQVSLSITNSRSSLRLTSIESVMPSSHLILRRPLLLLPPIPPTIRVCSNESTLRMRWPKYWSFSFSIIPSKEHPGLISFRMDWLGLLAVQGTLKSLLQHHSSKASIFGAQPSQSNCHIHTWPLEKP